MNGHDKEELELDLFISLVKRVYDYDFNEYRRASIKRRIKHLVVQNNLEHISELIPRVLYQEDFRQHLLQCVSVTVTEMFRDPWVFRTLRDEVMPALTILPKIHIWHAGCATGEEVYSMAIILKECGLLEHTTIHATDFNEASLDIARRGEYPLENIKQHTKNYIAAGGTSSFADYYSVNGKWAVLDSALKKNIAFYHHDLAVDPSFGKMNMIICRNVLIYFQKNLQERVFELFNSSLTTNSFLVLGDKESTEFSVLAKIFTHISSSSSKIYRRT